MEKPPPLHPRRPHRQDPRCEPHESPQRARSVAAGRSRSPRRQPQETPRTPTAGSCATGARTIRPRRRTWRPPRRLCPAPVSTGPARHTPWSRDVAAGRAGAPARQHGGSGGHHAAPGAGDGMVCGPPQGGPHSRHRGPFSDGVAAECERRHGRLAGLDLDMLHTSGGAPSDPAGGPAVRTPSGALGAAGLAKATAIPARGTMSARPEGGGTVQGCLCKMTSPTKGRNRVGHLHQLRH
jgi:hypothetical protein